MNYWLDKHILQTLTCSVLVNTYPILCKHVPSIACDVIQDCLFLNENTQTEAPDIVHRIETYSGTWLCVIDPGHAANSRGDHITRNPSEILF